jgi:hypothetical protein
VPEPRFVEVDIVIEISNTHEYPGIHQIQAGLIQT